MDHIQYYAGPLIFILPQFPPVTQITIFLELPITKPKINPQKRLYCDALYHFYRDPQLQV